MKITALIAEALADYGLIDAEYELLRHNENITCKVVRGKEKFALRIHQPVKGFCTALITDGLDENELFRSEAELLLHLSLNGFGGLQQPVLRQKGELVAVLSGGVPAMLLTWIEGEPINPEEGPAYAEKLGEMIAKLHRAAAGFTGTRIRYDPALCDRLARELGEAVRMGHISEAAGQKCRSELEAVKRVQNRLMQTQGACVIHSDLSFGNILVTENGLIPIVFSLSGYGCPAQEAGMAMSNYQDEESCVNFLKGMAEAGENVDRTDTDIFLSLSVLLFVSSQHNKVYAEEWFAEALERWCGELFIHA